MTEQDKWNFFEAKRKARLEKHKSNMAEGCTGCNIGRVWLPADYVNLCAALKPGFTLETLSEALDRPVFGILSKLKYIGIADPKDTGKSYWTTIRPVSRFYIERRWLPKEAMLAALQANGWYYKEEDGKVKTNYLFPPDDIAWKPLRRK